MAARDINLFVRVKGTAEAARGLANVTAELHRMGQQSRRTSDLARNMGRSFSAMGNEMATVGRRVGYTLTAMATAATYTGLKFNATMESQKVAFATFLGGKAKADAYVKSLVDIATATPFRLTDLIAGTRQLLAFGMAGEEAKHTMELMANAIASSAGGADEVERASRALGQVQAAGVLHAQDLNQLVNAGVISIPLLAARAGKTTKEYRKEMSLGKITSVEFFKAAREGWESDPMYQGAAEKQMRTFNGQLERTKDLFERAMGAMTYPLFTLLAKKILPAAGETLGVFEKIWDPEQPRKFSERVRESGIMFKAIWGPVRDDFTAWWSKTGMTEKLEEQWEAFVAWLGPAARQAGKDAASKLWQMWQGSSVVTKELTALALLTRLGITRTVMAGAAGILWAYLMGGTVPGKKGPGGSAIGGGGAGVMNVTAGVVNVYQGTGKGGKTPPGTVVAPGGKSKKPPSPASRAGGFLGRAAKSALILDLAVSAAQGAQAWATGGSTSDILKAADPTSFLTMFGLPQLAGSDKKMRAAGWDRWLENAVGNTGNWLSGVPGSVGGWAGSRWKGGIRTNGNQWYPNQAAADAALIGGLGARSDTVLRNTPPEVIRAMHAATDRQNMTNNTMMPRLSSEMYGPPIIIQIDGKTIATATHNASTKKKASR